MKVDLTEMGFGGGGGFGISGAELRVSDNRYLVNFLVILKLVKRLSEI
jgi:hypothetical protein